MAELDKLNDDLSHNPPDEVLEKNILDLVSLENIHTGNLEVFKKTRSEMILKRDALKKAIKIMDKRIDIALATLKVLKTPT